MRAVITFTVAGAGREELEDRALEVYRGLVGDPAAEIPFSATIEISPKTEASDGAGNVLSRRWAGEVSITLPHGTEARR